MGWDPRAPGVGEQAPDLLLLDEEGRPLQLSSLALRGPLLALVFQGVDDEAGLALLRDYRDATLALRRAGVSLCGVAHAEPSALAYLRRERGLGFPLLADADGAALARWGMPAGTGLFLLDRGLRVRQRALGGRASAEMMLAYLRRGGARDRRTLRERAAHLLHALSHALRPHRLAR